MVAGKVESIVVTRKDQYNYKQSNAKWTPISTVLFRIKLLTQGGALHTSEGLSGENRCGCKQGGVHCSDKKELV